MMAQHNSLLRNFRLHLCTWNVAETGPPQDVDGVLGIDKSQLPQLTAVGIQEIAFASDWLETLTNAAARKGYVRIKDRQLRGMYLMVFVLREHLLYIQNIESESTQTGLGGLWGSKGGVSIRMDLYGINLCIVNCHLAAHMHQLNARINDFEDIIESQRYRDKDVDLILDHDYVFWIGDLNFRIEELSKVEIENRVSAGDLESMVQYDQLTNIKRDEIAFLDFEEGPITFNPTYKYDPNTDTYDTSKKQRKPAWTDRILWMIHEDSFENASLSATQHDYSRLDGPTYWESDHRPIKSDFTIKVFKQGFPLPPIEFEPVANCLVNQDCKCKYKVSSGYKVNPWDWIGLYKVDFKHLHDYETYYWAMDDGNITFDKAYITTPGTYVFVYKASSKKHGVKGISNAFEIRSSDGSTTEQKKEL